MRIAIIGGGISGLVAGHLLRKEHQVTLFEANDYIGGHTNTIDMSFSVTCEKTGLEYGGNDLNGLFAQRKNLVSPKFLRLLWDLIKFNRMGSQILSNDFANETVAEFFQRHKYSETFIKQYFLPMGAAIWSSSFKSFMDFPIKFIAEFYENHGLLSITNRPQWYVIQGGSKQYIEPLTRDWVEAIHLKSPIKSVVRTEKSVKVKPVQNDPQEFDHVIFACHSDQALTILGSDATTNEQEILSAFPYQKNVATLHTQKSLLPKNRRAWACWNYYNPVDETEAATVTYNMNMLQSLDSQHTFCVTLNDTGRIQPENVLQTFNYAHPTFGIDRSAMQARHGELIGENRTSFCGAYWGNGFHEDGVKSAIAVADGVSKLKLEVAL